MTTPRLELSSPSNPRVKAAARLRDRREREATGHTIVDGAREVRRALDAGVEVVEAFVHEPWLAGADTRMALDILRARDAPITATTETAFSKIAFGDRADGIVVIVRTPDQSLERIRLGDDSLVVVLQGLEKPGNLGAILRSADGAGADAVIAASPRTDLFNPNVIRASAGTVFGVPVATASSDRVIDWLSQRGIRIVAARIDGAVEYSDADLRGPLAFVLGSEADGLSDKWRGPQISTVRLPMRGVADSLNVSVTAAILLYEAQRQRAAAAPARIREPRTPD